METKKTDFTFEYMALGRCQMDCNTYINDKGFKWGCRSFYGGETVAEHITEMKSLYNQVPEKPEWLLFSQIEKYEKEMLEIELYNKLEDSRK